MKTQLVLNRATLPTDKQLRKKFPIGTGVLDYFPDAIAAVAYVSYVGNAQHNGPNTPCKWTRPLSDDHADTVLRHFVERGGFDVDKTRHTAKMVWRALAILQLEVEAARERGEPGLCEEDVTVAALPEDVRHHLCDACGEMYDAEMAKD